MGNSSITIITTCGRLGTGDRGASGLISGAATVAALAARSSRPSKTTTAATTAAAASSIVRARRHISFRTGETLEGGFGRFTRRSRGRRRP